MKGLRSNPVRRGLAWMLALLLVAPYLLVGKPAQAQRGGTAAYVLDFNNKTKVGGLLLGRVAAAQVSLQLADSPNWEITPEAQVVRRREELNLQPPYDRIARVQIANGVDALAAIYGTILEAQVTTGATPRALVRLQVLVEDIATGVLINGAVTTGESTPRMGYTGDADILLEEALGKAAFKAREFMDRFRLPGGTVLNTTVVGVGENARLEVLLNIGARNGVKQGMEFIITRLREPVGVVKITSVDSDFSTGNVVENTQGVQPQDHARAIFNFADFPVTRMRLRSALPEGDGVKLASAKITDQDDEKKPARVALAEKGAILRQFRAQDPNAQVAQVTVDEPSPVVVDEPEVETGGTGRGGRKSFLKGAPMKMLVGGLLVMGILAIGGRGGQSATRAVGTEAAGHQAQIGAPGAFIRVQWNRPKSVRTSQVEQYIIWRTDNLGSSLAIVGALDTDARKSFLDSENDRNVNAFDGDPGTEDAGTRGTVIGAGIIAGNQYRYQIATAYENGLEDRDEDGEVDDAIYMSPLSATSPWATAISPAAISAPTNNQQVQIDQVAFSWQQTPGADQYVIWASRSPSFTDARRVAFGPFRTLPVDQGGDTEITRTVDIRSSRLPTSGRVFLTVGARNSQDAKPPRPFGYIFSAPIQVQAEVTPPPPPGAPSLAGSRKKSRTNGGKNGKGSTIDGGGKGKSRQ